MLVETDKILIEARREDYDVIAVSCSGLELIKAATSAAEKKCSPVILNIGLKYDFARGEQDVGSFLCVTRQWAMRSVVSVAINLDHGQNYQTAVRATSHGFTSVTVNISSGPYEENVIVTKEMVHVTHSIGLPVETEFSYTGTADETFALENKYTESTKTGPTMVKDLVEKIGVDFLAISIGDAHGPYAKNITPHIGFDLLEEIAAVTPIPLVPHGDSGTEDENLLKACKMRINKINVGTNLMETAIRKTGQRYQENLSMGRINFLTNYISGYQGGIKHYMDAFGSTRRVTPPVTPKTKCSHPES